MSFLYLGSVSTGTMRTEDLIPTFASVLADLDAKKASELATEYANWEDDQESANWYFDALSDALNDAAPDYVHFGANEGDGADYGFWIHWESLEDDCRDDAVRKIADLADWPADTENLDAVLLVNDHGNATLYSTDREELWACV